MQIDLTTLIIFLMGALQAVFLELRRRDAQEMREIKETIKSMDSILRKMQSELAVTKFALVRKESLLGEKDHE